MPNGIFLTPKDVMKLRGHSNYKNAWRYLNRIAKELNKPKSNSVTIDDFCELYAVKKTIVLKALNE